MLQFLEEKVKEIKQICQPDSYESTITHNSKKREK